MKRIQTKQTQGRGTESELKTFIPRSGGEKVTRIEGMIGPTCVEVLNKYVDFRNHKKEW